MRIEQKHTKETKGLKKKNGVWKTGARLSFWRAMERVPSPRAAGTGTGRGVPEEGLLSPALSSTSLWRRGRNPVCAKTGMRAKDGSLMFLTQFC